jgi:hypothetical protein
MWADVKEGFQYLLSNRRMLYIVGLSYVTATFVAPYNRFVPVFATNVLHVGASGFGVLMSAPGLGATFAALTLASVNKLRVGIRAICFSSMGFGLAIGLFRVFAQFRFVVSLSRDGRLLSNLRTRAFQHGHSECNTQ